jgi:hypothetical protein
MNLTWIALAIAFTMPPSSVTPPSRCPEVARARQVARRMSELPADIREDLLTAARGEIRDVDVSLLNTDAPTERERSYATLRFARAVRFERFWLVQIEVAMVSGVTTLSYFRTGQGTPRGGTWVRTNEHNFRGPACASIRAALEGVTIHGGLAPDHSENDERGE